MTALHQQWVEAYDRVKDLPDPLDRADREHRAQLRQPVQEVGQPPGIDQGADVAPVIG